MGFFDLTKVDRELVTPRHSTAFGELVTGNQIEVGRLNFRAGEGAQPHSHPQEQILLVLEGSVRMTLAEETADLGPGMGFHALPGIEHALKALEDSVVISCKAVIEGAGHRI